jgi:ABC-2 type transport system permease protein
VRVLATGPVSIIARKEAIELFRDGGFRWGVLILIALLIGAGAVGVTVYVERESASRLLAQGERARWLGQGQKHPHVAAHQGIVAVKPQLPTAILDPGVDAHAGTTVSLEAHAQRLLSGRAVDDHLALQRLGHVTVAIVLQQYVPLLIILLGFSCVAGERDRGTLPMLMATGVSARQILAGKAIGFLAPMLTVSCLAAMGGAATLVLIAGPADGSTVVRAGIIAVAHALYALLALLATLVVSARAASQAQALAILFGLWLFAGLLGPHLVNEVAERRHPAPHALQFAGDLQRARADGPLWYERLLSLENRLRKTHGVERLDALKINVFGVGMAEEEADESAVQRAAFDRLYAVYGAQERVRQSLVALVPLIAVRSVSMGAAATDVDELLMFARATETYRFDFVQLLNQHLAKYDKPGQLTTDEAGAYTAGPELWAQVSPFLYAPRSIAATWTNQRWHLGVLTGWVLIGLAAVAWTTHHGTVRVR